MNKDELRAAWQELGIQVGAIGGIIDYVKILKPGALKSEIDRIKQEIDKLVEIIESEQ